MQHEYKVIARCFYQNCIREPGRHDTVFLNEKLKEEKMPSSLEYVGAVEAGEPEVEAADCFASAAAQALAAEYDEAKGGDAPINWGEVEGTSQDGKLTKADVEAAIAAAS